MKVRATFRQIVASLPRRVPGQYYITDSPTGPVVRSWPKRKRKNRTPAQLYREAEFARAAAWASNASGQETEAANNIARGTLMLPRDFLTAGAYGTLNSYTLEDGTELIGYRTVTINAQLVLDQVTDTAGALLWRSPAGWVEIEPGSQGQLLTIDAGEPAFRTVVPPLSSALVMYPPMGFINGFNDTINANTLTGSPVALQAGTQINALAVQGGAASATTKLQPCIHYNNVGVGNTLVAQGPQVTGVVNGWNILPLDATYTVLNTGTYFCNIITTVANWTTVAANSTTMAATWTFSSTPPSNAAFVSGGVGNGRARAWAVLI